MSATLGISDARIFEGNGAGGKFTYLMEFTVTLSEASSEQVAVNYATADGTATAGRDYNAAAGTITFAPGETVQTITIEVIGDNREEPEETFQVILSGAMNAGIDDGLGIGTIADDDFRAKGRPNPKPPR